MWKTSAAHAPVLKHLGTLAGRYMTHKFESGDPYTFRDGFAAVAG